jgi:hypothetical protein
MRTYEAPIFYHPELAVVLRNLNSSKQKQYVFENMNRVKTVAMLALLTHKRYRV